MNQIRQKVDETHHGLIRDYPALRNMCDPVRYATTIELLAEHCAPGTTIADIGAWPGGLTAHLSRMGWKVIAVDKDADRSVSFSRASLLQPAAEQAPGQKFSFENLCHREGITITNVNIEANPLPLASDSLDGVVLTEVIEHLWHDPLFALAEINRVLKTNTGVLILSTPNLISLRNRMNFLTGHTERVIEHPFVSYLKYRRLGHLGHVRLYAPKELESMLSLFGFEPRVTFTQAGKLLYYGETEYSTSAGGDQASGNGSGNTGAMRFVKKFIRTPKGYASAIGATSLDWLEKMHPPFRPQVFVTARKIMDANFEINRPRQVEELLLQNSMG